ncbi:MAG: hypothetical protein LBD31_03405 [Treponema sp.]|nr:hypothetical protein [Treponema sp.]
MGFGDTLKELLDQGVQVSRELAARAGEKVQDWGGRGLEASKELAAKAGAKAQELGERGVLLLEIKQLEGQARKLVGRLGAEVYTYFEGGETSLNREEPGISNILEEIASIRSSIDKREAELKVKS